MPQNYVEISLRSGVDSGELFAMLQDRGALGCWEEKEIIHIYWPEEKWTPEILMDVKRILGVLGEEDSDSHPEIRVLPDKDWNSAWAASLAPIQLGKSVRIRQSWHAPDPDFDGIELIIDPKRAFGTGHHATTLLVVEWLEENIRGGERILDIGTGTGILAMVALRLGADSALAIDNDPAALECARENAAANNFGSELELQTEDLENLAAGGFDVAVANISGKAIPKLCAKLPGIVKSGGSACLSGLLQQDRDQITAALDKAGLQIRNRMVREEWLALEVSLKTESV